MTEHIRRDFGQVRQIGSGRWQARWRLAGIWYTARRESDGGPMTFTTERKAADHLAWVRREIEAGRWRPPTTAPGKAPTLHEYADAWLTSRDLAGHHPRPLPADAARAHLPDLR